MKVKICNLGVIGQAEVEIKPLTVFVGPNNAGKTWIAYMLSGILGSHGWSKYAEAYSAGGLTKAYSELDAAVLQIVEQGNAKIDLVKFAEEYSEEYINHVASLSRRWMQEFMGTERMSFGNVKVQITLGETQTYFLESVKHARGDFRLGIGRQKTRLTATKQREESVLYFYTAAEENLTDEIPLRAIRNFVSSSVFQMLHRALYSDVYPFPTERTTFITLPFTRVARAEEENETIRMDERPEARRHLPAPVGQFLMMMTRIYESDFSARLKRAKTDPAISDYLKLSQILEGEILSGSIDFSKPTPEPQRELLFQPVEGVTLEMPIVSSMVKELSPLVLYLRHLARSHHLLVIDEPEMNLHPQAQVRLIEFLAMLVNAGLHIIVTTHSPYLVDHLVNLMKAFELGGGEKIQSKFYLKRAEAFIPKERVSVYLFQDGTAKSILSEEGMIDWGTFGGISDQVAQIYFDIQE